MIAGSIGGRWLLVIGAVGCSLLAAGTARATTVSGAITSDQSWTLAGSPYVMTGDVTVGAGVTLTVDAGVTVVAAATDALAAGASPSLVELNVNGTLLVNGTAANPVAFTSANASGWAEWYGVVVASGGAATINGASFSHASYGLWWQAGTLNLTDSSFDHDTYGVYVQGGTAFLTGVSVTGASVGVNAGSATVVMHTSVLSGNQVGAVPGMMWVYNSTFDHNVTGLQQTSGIGVRLLQLSDSLVTNNTSYGVLSTSPGGVIFDGVGFYGNGTAFQAPGATGTPSYCNPLYVSSSDLHLTSNSPYLTAGSSGEPYGALPYRGDQTPGLYGVLRSNTTLTGAGSPYAIPGDLEVAPGVTLTLDPGATLSFANHSDIMNCGSDATRSELRVHGSLDAIGTSLSPITLTTSGTLSSTAWSGLHAFADATPLTLSHFELAGALTAVQVDGSALALFDHGLVHDSATGLSASNLSLDSVVVHHTSAGVALATGSVTNLLAYSNTHGIEVTGGPVTVANATFSDDTTAVYALSGGVTVENSVLAHGSYALYGSGTVQYSDVWDFTQPFGGSGSNNLFVDPGFVASPGDWHLLPGSACIDAGTSASAPEHDLDGTPRPLDGGSGVARWDLGAYEYAGAPGVAGSGGSAGVGSGSGGIGGTAGAGGTLGSGGSAGFAGTSGAGGAPGNGATGGTAGGSGTSAVGGGAGLDASGGSGGVVNGSGGVVNGSGGVVNGSGGVVNGSGGVVNGSGGVVNGSGGVVNGSGGSVSVGGTGATGGEAGAPEGGASGEAGVGVDVGAGAPGTGGASGSSAMPSAGATGAAATGGGENGNAGEPATGSGGTSSGATGGTGAAAGGKPNNQGGSANGGKATSAGKSGAGAVGAAGGSSDGPADSGCGCRVSAEHGGVGQFAWTLLALTFLRRGRPERRKSGSRA